MGSYETRLAQTGFALEGSLISLELWTAIATIGTFVVLAAGTAVALIQLSHLRSSNQLQALVDLGQELQPMAPHLAFVYHELPRKMEDPEFRRGRPCPGSRPASGVVAVFLDRSGLLVKLKPMLERFPMEFGGGGADATLAAVPTPFLNVGRTLQT